MSIETAAQFSELWPIIMSYVFAGFTVCMFGVNEFCKSPSPNLAYAKNVIAQASPDELTSERHFLTAWIVYVFGLLVIFAILSATGQYIFPVIATSLKLDPATLKVVLPVVAAFCLVGFMPHIPGLKQLEQWWREFMHRRASIPSRIHAVMEELRPRDFCYDRLSTSSINGLVQFGNPEARLEALHEAFSGGRLSASAENWIFLSGLISAIPIARANAGRRMGARFITRHMEHFNSLSFEHRELKEKLFKDYTPGPVENFNSRCDTNDREIGELLENAKTFIGCIIASRPDEVPLGEALYLYFFNNNRNEAVENKKRDERDILLLSLGLGLLVSFLLVCFVPFLTMLFSASWSKGLPDFPNYGNNLLGWLLGDQFKYAPLLFLALAYRHREISNGRWFSGAQYRVRVVEYGKVFVLVALLTIPFDLVSRSLLWSINGQSVLQQGFVSSTITRCALSPVLISVFAVSTMVIFDKAYRKRRGWIFGVTEGVVAGLICLLAFLFNFVFFTDFNQTPINIDWTKITVFLGVELSFFLTTLAVMRLQSVADPGQALDLSYKEAALQT